MAEHKIVYGQGECTQSIECEEFEATEKGIVVEYIKQQPVMRGYEMRKYRLFIPMTSIIHIETMTIVKVE